MSCVCPAPQVFYVHPTTFYGKRWNQPLGGAPHADEQLGYFVLALQAHPALLASWDTF